MKRYKRHRAYGFFDQDIRLTKLSKLGDPLEKLNGGIDFDIFRDLMDEKFTKNVKKNIHPHPFLQRKRGKKSLFEGRFRGMFLFKFMSKEKFVVHPKILTWFMHSKIYSITKSDLKISREPKSSPNLHSNILSLVLK